MSQIKIDSGTIIVDQKGSEIGVVKKIYNERLARLELVNSESVPLDLTLITNVNISGRILKKKNATIIPEYDIFLKGAVETLNKIHYDCLELIIEHLLDKEIKKALQYFEFDLITTYEIVETLPYYEVLGLIRGIELAAKTPQDFIVKCTFNVAEIKSQLKLIVPPEIVVDKLNQEKAFIRILWNAARLVITQVIKQKNSNLIKAMADVLFEISLKYIEVELKEIEETNPIYWSNRIEDCVIKYIALMINSLEIEKQAEILNSIKTKLLEDLNKMKINSVTKEQAIKTIESFNIDKYEKSKAIELMHSGIKGFNLRVMVEKKALKELKGIIENFLEKESTRNIVNLQKVIIEFNRNARDISKDLSDLLIEVVQYLKKVEYGDSKANEFFSNLTEKIFQKKYYDLGNILKTLNKEYVKK